MQNANSNFIVRIETCVDCGDEFIINLEEFIKKTESGMRLPKRCIACRKNADTKEIRMPAGFQRWDDIQQLKVIVIVYMVADNERKVSNNEIF